MNAENSNSFRAGDAIRVVRGPFKTHEGTIAKVNLATGTVEWRHDQESLGKQIRSIRDTRIAIVAFGFMVCASTRQSRSRFFDSLCGGSGDCVLGFHLRKEAKSHDPRPPAQPGPELNAHRIVAESTADHSETPTDLEGAWEKWSRSIQRVDERGMTLLRAAFEAGFEAGAPQRTSFDD